MGSHWVVAGRIDTLARIAYAGGFTATACVLIVTQSHRPLREPPISSPDAGAALRAVDDELRYPSAFELGVSLGEHDEACSYRADGDPRAQSALESVDHRVAAVRAALGMPSAPLTCDQQSASSLAGLSPDAVRYASYGYALYVLDRTQSLVGTIPPAMQATSDDVEHMTTKLGLEPPPGGHADLPFAYKHIVGVPWELPEELRELRDTQGSGSAR